MENYVWFGVVVAGPVCLGAALAWSLYRQNRRHSLLTFVTVVLLLIGCAYVTLRVGQEETTPLVSPDNQDSHYERPAAPSHDNLPPGTPPGGG